MTGYEEPRIFGAPAVVEDDDLADLPETSPLDELVAELGQRIERITTVSYEIDGRPGWWIEFDTGFSVQAMQALTKRASAGKSGEPDLLKLAFLVTAEFCTAIGKDETTVFESQPIPGVGGARMAGPFKNGAVEQALGDRLVARPGEKSWQAAIRWVLGVEEDERFLMQLATAVQNANAGQIQEHVAGRPTE